MSARPTLSSPTSTQSPPPGRTSPFSLGPSTVPPLTMNTIWAPAAVPIALTGSTSMLKSHRCSTGSSESASRSSRGFVSVSVAVAIAFTPFPLRGLRSGGGGRLGPLDLVLHVHLRHRRLELDHVDERVLPRDEALGRDAHDVEAVEAGGLIRALRPEDQRPVEDPKVRAV